ncbi:MAG TPA: hypothetical protein VHB51_00085 [Candidatus Saccharimonadales bacterium]|nr:hypothetical protein [Candidatus Saccharimonadales bacterium]
MDENPKDQNAPAATPGDPKSELAAKLKAATNILVTVSRDPSVDQLAACIGLTLALNKLNKHTAAVFSGEVPSTLEFLQPEETLEKTTDSLRDFIIALDKSKADKLRYKVEDNVVRIFITPYRTSINEDDLEFSQGDFNVDLVLGLGVQEQGDLDEAIVNSGRILHDAPVATINTQSNSELGSINWQEPTASSLSELVTELVKTLGKDLLDQQIATALLTGVIAETARFSNEKTTPETMSISSDLMAAGANSQLVSSKLDEPPAGGVSIGGPQGSGDKSGSGAGHDGTLEIDHAEPADGAEPADEPVLPAPDDQVELDTEAAETKPPAEAAPAVEAAPPAPTPAMPEPTGPQLTPGPTMITEPPATEGLVENVEPVDLELPADPLSLPSTQTLTHHDDQIAPMATPAAPMAAPAAQPPSGPATAPPLPDSQTLKDIEAAVRSEEAANPAPAAAPAAAPGLNIGDVRDQVSQAFTDTTPPPAPIAALNAQPMGDPLHGPADATPAPEVPAADTAASAPASDIAYDPAKFGITETPTTPSAGQPAAPSVTDSTAPPPVPPPIPFQFGSPPNPGA